MSNLNNFLFRQVNGRLILDGVLRVCWGIENSIRLKEFDDKRVIAATTSTTKAATRTAARSRNTPGAAAAARAERDRKCRSMQVSIRPLLQAAASPKEVGLEVESAVQDAGPKSEETAAAAVNGVNGDSEKEDVEKEEEGGKVEEKKSPLRLKMPSKSDCNANGTDDDHTSDNGNTNDKTESSIDDDRINNNNKELNDLGSTTERRGSLDIPPNIASERFSSAARTDRRHRTLPTASKNKSKKSYKKSVSFARSNKDVEDDSPSTAPALSNEEELNKRLSWPFALPLAPSKKNCLDLPAEVEGDTTVERMRGERKEWGEEKESGLANGQEEEEEDRQPKSLQPKLEGGGGFQEDKVIIGKNTLVWWPSRRSFNYHKHRT